MFLWNISHLDIQQSSANRAKGVYASLVAGWAALEPAKIRAIKRATP
jgi:hypothetical protein